MIFSVQHYLEDYFHQRNFRDIDQYAVKLANLYARKRQSEQPVRFLKAMRRIQTVFYKNNSEIERAPTEKEILRRLDGKFQKKASKRLT
jgi:protein-disulfide isomerase-like protein with CxxC motif